MTNIRYGSAVQPSVAQWSPVQCSRGPSSSLTTSHPLPNLLFKKPHSFLCFVFIMFRRFKDPYILWGSYWSCLLWDTRTLCNSIIRDLRITSQKCDQCEFAMVLACNLRIYLKTHTGETPHKCKQCDFASIIANH